MTCLRLVSILVLAGVSLAAAPAWAESYRGGPGLPLDPQLLPANSAPGDCVVRRMTGPGGAYRWDRVECDADRGWSDHDRWGYGRPLDIEVRQDAYAQGPRRDDRYGPGPGYDAYRYGYVAAGRDEAGFLIWPGKTP
jgi:hypothetical protein